MLELIIHPLKHFINNKHRIREKYRILKSTNKLKNVSSHTNCSSSIKSGILVHYIYFAFLRTDIFRMLHVTPLFAYVLGVLHCGLMT